MLQLSPKERTDSCRRKWWWGRQPGGGNSIARAYGEINWVVPLGNSKKCSVGGPRSTQGVTSHVVQAG